MKRLIDLVAERPRLFVITGAGVSTGSGIPAYRDPSGTWTAGAPIELRAFMSNPDARRRYWARGLIGWPSFHAARPNRGHLALARLEAAGYVHQLVTQNVDGLHSRAGSRDVIELHGRNDRVRCTGCHHILERERFQGMLVSLNRDLLARLEAASYVLGPDGDAGPGDARPGGEPGEPSQGPDPVDYNQMRVPDCPACGGILRPDVVFFGDAVPRERVAQAQAALAGAHAVLAVGTSLSVLSGFRYCRAAHAANQPIWLINRGTTRADELASHKVSMDCSEALEALAASLAPKSPPGDRA